MKIDKEYPATHSMSTSWYIVDEEGNVGIMDFNENGPVPIGVNENDGTYLAFGLYDDFEKRHKNEINLTEEQILDLLEESKDFNTLQYVFDEIIKIDTSKEDAFFELMKNNDVKLIRCLSKPSGLYLVDFADCISNKKTADGTYIKLRSTFRKLLKERILLKLFEMKDLYTNDSFKDGELLYEKRFDECPYYVYLQSYWTEYLQKRVHIPKNPVKIEQVSKNLQKKMLHIPVKFASQEFIQIAEWFRSNTYGYEYATIEGLEYTRMPLTNGTMAWFCVDNDAPENLPYGYIITEERMKQLEQENKAIIK